MVIFLKTSQIAILKIGWAKHDQFSNRCLTIRSIFKQTVKNTPPQGAAAPRGSALGAPPEAAPVVLLQNVFENGPDFQTSVWKWIIFGSSYFQNRHWSSFWKFPNLAGDASYHCSAVLWVAWLGVGSTCFNLLRVAWPESRRSLVQPTTDQTLLADGLQRLFPKCSADSSGEGNLPS